MSQNDIANSPSFRRHRSSQSNWNRGVHGVQQKMTTMESRLDKYLCGLIHAFGSTRVSSLIYGRELNDAMCLMMFPLRKVSRDYFTTCNLALVFEHLSEIFHGDRPGRPVPQIFMPIHLLRPNTHFTEWEFQDTRSMVLLGDAICNDLRSYAQPFFDRYSKMTETRKCLENSKEDPFVLTSEQRITLLAALQYVQDDKTIAVKTLDDALFERKDAPLKKRFPIESLRRKLSALP